MFEFLPDWVKAICGTGLMLFIGIAGFKLTSKGKSNDGNGDAHKSNDTNNSRNNNTGN